MPDFERRPPTGAKKTKALGNYSFRTFPKHHPRSYAPVFSCIAMELPGCRKARLMTRFRFPTIWRCQLTISATMFRITLIILLVLTFAGCATTRTKMPFEPTSINEVRFRDRSQSEYDQDVRVTTAVPSAEESEAIFGANLANLEIQPIWVKIENHSDKTYYFVSAAVDPNYFSPNEASHAVHGGLNKNAQREMEYYFRSIAFRNPILPNTAVSGFCFFKSG